MQIALLAFAAGVVAFQLSPALPERPYLLVLALIVALAASSPRLRGFAALALGSLWAAGYASWALDQRLDPDLQGVPLVLIGQVVSIPEEDMRRTRFVFKPERLVEGPAEARLPRRLRLSWYGNHPPPAAGERWQLPVRLRAPQGLRREGFDYARWLYVNRLDGIGYVAAGPAERLGSARGLAALRARVGGAVYAAVAEPAPAGLLLALVVGDRQFIEAASWQALGATGTGHLLAISGLHIGLVAGGVFFFVSAAWRRLPGLCRRLPAPAAAAVAGLAAAAGYAALAGFTLPTQRALLMLAVGFGALLLRRFVAPWQALVLALAAVLAWDPAAPLTAGFWLSFAAVAVILAASVGHARLRPAWLAAVRLQLAISLALVPLLVLWFEQVPLTSPLANLVAIPLVSVLVVPLALLGALSLFLWEPLGITLLGTAAVLTEHLLSFLAWLQRASEDYAGLPRPAPWALLWALAAALLLLTPRGLPGRWLSLPLLLPMLLWRPERPAADELWLTLAAGGIAVEAADGRLWYGSQASLAAGLRWLPLAEEGARACLGGDGWHWGEAAWLRPVPWRSDAGAQHCLLEVVTGEQRLLLIPSVTLATVAQAQGQVGAAADLLLVAEPAAWPEREALGPQLLQAPGDGTGLRLRLRPGEAARLQPLAPPRRRYFHD